MSYLSKSGERVYAALQEHCKQLKMKDADSFELMMLANCFDIYAQNAEYCRDNGMTQAPEKGGWDQVRPEYTIMKNEYQNILKHSAKFGLNPADRDRLFKGLTKEKKKGFDLTK
jgi:P27 family predicted phage terminase small subunit